MTSPPLVSVVLCAYNPREDYLQATLDSLRAQDLPLSEWELIVVDNNSQPPLAGHCDLGWHPAGRIVVETNQGLAHARRRGYIEARGELIIHSDDDNVLAPDYLSTARRIYRDQPRIGTFGGQRFATFEIEPRNDLERSFGGERRIKTDRWTNIPDDTRAMPFGAGMCLRREVVTAYLRQVDGDPRRLSLGRTGTRLLTGEDLDLNYVATGLGLGTGLFAALNFRHFIPRKHMTEDHVVRYAAANAYSVILLKFLHYGMVDLGCRSLPARLLLWLRVYLRMTPFARRREIAMHRARLQAVRDMRAWQWIK